MTSIEPTVHESADGCEWGSGHTHDEARASYASQPTALAVGNWVDSRLVGHDAGVGSYLFPSISLWGPLWLLRHLARKGNPVNRGPLSDSLAAIYQTTPSVYRARPQPDLPCGGEGASPTIDSQARCRRTSGSRVCTESSSAAAKAMPITRSFVVFSHFTSSAMKSNRRSRRLTAAPAIAAPGLAGVNGMVLAAVRLLSRLSEEIEEYATARLALANAPQASGSPCDGSAPESVSISQQPGSP